MHSVDKEEKSEKEQRSKFLVLLLSASIFATCFPLEIPIGASIRLRVDIIILFLTALAILLVFSRGRVLLMPPTGIRVCFTLLLFILLFSTLCSSIASAHVWSFGNVIHEVTRIIKYAIVFLIFWFGAQYAGARESLQRAFLVSALAVLAVGFMQYFNVLGIDKLTIRYFSLPEYTSIFIGYRPSGMQRVSSTFGNANILATFLLIPLGICFARAVVNRKWSYGILTIVFFAGLLVTQARAIMICAILLLLTTLIIARKRSRPVSGRGPLIAILIVTILIVMSFYMITRLNLRRVTQISTTEGSWTIRINKMEKFGSSVYQKNPLFGLSPAKDPGEALEIDYLVSLYYSGIIGLTVYIAFLYLLYKYIPKDVDSFNIAIAAIMITFLLVNITYTTFYSERVFSLFLMMYATAVSGCYVADPVTAEGVLARAHA